MQHRHLEWYSKTNLISLGPNDPQILVSFEWDLTNAEAFLEKKRKETGLPLTITHLVGYCVARAFKDQPDLNGRLSFGNVFHPLNFVSITQRNKWTSRSWFPAKMEEYVTVLMMNY